MARSSRGSPGLSNNRDPGLGTKLILLLITCAQTTAGAGDATLLWRSPSSPVEVFRLHDSQALTGARGSQPDSPEPASRPVPGEEGGLHWAGCYSPNLTPWLAGLYPPGQRKHQAPRCLEQFINTMIPLYDHTVMPRCGAVFLMTCTPNGIVLVCVVSVILGLRSLSVKSLQWCRDQDSVVEDGGRPLFTPVSVVLTVSLVGLFHYG